MLRDIKTDIRGLTYRYSALKRKTDLDGKTISRIEKSLPDYLVVKKDKHGNTQIPHEFWGALRDLIQSDDKLITGRTASVPSSGGKSISAKEFEKRAGQVWEKYMKDNEAKIMSANDFEAKFPHLFKKNILASKSEIVDMVRQNWEVNQGSVEQELSKLTKQLDKAKADILELRRSPAGMSQDRLRSMIASHISNILPIAQIEALIRANIKGNVNWGLTRINHWSPGTGAVVNIQMTSPNYAFDPMNAWGISKFFRWMIGNPIPAPNPPEAALTKWDEHGDCWCTPANDNDGFGAALGVISGQNIYPDQVIVEHIAPSASLEPGAAPKDMELLVFAEDYDTFDPVAHLSQQIFGEPDRALAKYRLIKIAEWTYDMEEGSNQVQAFPVQIDLRQFSADTNKLVVRAKNNWGGGDVGYTCMYRIRVHGDPATTSGL